MYQIIGNHGLPIFQGDWNALQQWVARYGLSFVLRIIAI